MCSNHGRQLERQKRYRKYRQEVGGKTVYFKELGDPRIMDSRSGQYLADGETLPREYQANEIMEFTIGTEPYGQVRWIGQVLGGGLADIMEGLSAALAEPLNIRWTEYSLSAALACLLCYGVALSIYSSEQGRRRDGEEHGSAAWGNPRQVNAEFAQKENKLLTQNVRLGLDTHKHRRSLNVLVIGGSGAAKTRGYVKPNILQANTNYVVTDPKSEVLFATGGLSEKQGL